MIWDTFTKNNMNAFTNSLRSASACNCEVPSARPPRFGNVFAETFAKVSRKVFVKVFVNI